MQRDARRAGLRIAAIELRRPRRSERARETAMTRETGSSHPRPTPGMKLSPLQTALEWGDLVLPREAQEPVDAIRALADGAAGAVLFHGPAGSGKSLTAALLGKALGRPVLAVDLSAIVSKY